MIVCLRFFPIQPHFTTSLSRCHLRHLLMSWDDMKRLHKLSKCCLWWCSCSPLCFRFPNSRNLQFSHPSLHIFVRGVVGGVLLSRLCQFIQSHLLLPKSPLAVLYCFGVCAHHTARFVILAQLVMPCILFISILILPIFLIFGICKIS